MSRLAGKIRLFGAFCLGIGLVSCGIQNYPGQPSVKTNGFAKLDLETVDEVGLWVYEVSYDNGIDGKGVEQIVTKLYPNAQTYTSNSRTNADGTLYRHKFAYKGAKIQLISLPKEGTILMPPDSEVMILVDYDKSMDEVDDRNLNEDDLFQAPAAMLASAQEALSLRWRLLKLGQFQEGKLHYRIDRIVLGKETLDFSLDPLRFSTSLSQTGVTLQTTRQQKLKAREFINSKFPKGYQGDVMFELGDGESIMIPLRLQTPETLKNSGQKLIIKELNEPKS